MKKRILSEGIIQYIFEPESGKHYGFNIIALIDRNNVLLLDTGYEKHASQVLQDISNMGLSLASVIITHFHSDHIYGLKALPKVQVYGSCEAHETLKKWETEDDYEFFLPNISIDDQLKISFGSHNLVLIKSPGHAKCSILVNIDNKFLHVGDEIMLSNEGVPLLPSIGREGVERHLNSLERLKDFKDLQFIPSHGIMLTGAGNITKDIENRMKYLKAILNNDVEISYEEAVKECDCSFLHKEWHEHIYR